MPSRGYRVNGHATGVSIGPEFISALKFIAEHLDMTQAGLVSHIDLARTSGNLSSAVRVYILEQMQGAARLGRPQFLPPRIIY